MAEQSKPERQRQANEVWCELYVGAMDPEEILMKILDGMHRLHQQRGPVWSQISLLTNHGSGVSSAIVQRFMRKPVPEEAIR
jgi:hypothetical protein